MGNTPHFGWAYPVVGGSNDVWGDVLNLLFIAVDQALWALNPPVTGTIDNMVIGSVVPKAGTFASLQSLGNFGVNGDMQVNGNVGIGMVPVNVLDITKNQNADTILRLINTDPGANANAGIRFENGSSAVLFRHNGYGFAPTGMNRTDGTQLITSGAGGLTLMTNAFQPIYFGIGAQEKMRIDANGHVGIGTVPSTTFDVLESGNGVAAGRISNLNTGANALAQWVATNGVNSVSMGMTGTAYGGGGFNVAASGQILSNGANLVVGTNSTQPLILVSANTERMRINDNGTVGVATNVNGGWTGNSRFEVNNNGSGFAISAYSTAVTPGAAAIITRVDNTNVSLIDFEYNGINVGRFITDGVGLGIAYPNRFSLQAPVTIYNPADSTTALVVAGSAAAVRLGTSGTTAAVEAVDQTGTAAYRSLLLSGTQVAFGISGNEKMRIDAAGNVGIGKVPTEILDIQRNVNGNTHVAIKNFDPGLGSNTALVLDNGTTSGYLQYQGIGATNPGNLIVNSASGTRFTLAGVEKMRIEGDGRVIINHSTDDNSTAFVVSGVTKGVRIGTNAGGSNIDGVDSTGSATYQPLNIGGSSLSLASNLAFPMTFGTNGVERMRINSVGQVMIGTTTPYFGPEILTIMQTSPGSYNLSLVNSNAAPGNSLVFRKLFSAAAPNNTSAFFDYMDDSASTRAYFFSNGGLANFSANNANLSDEGVKDYITPYDDNELAALEQSFTSVIWGKYKYRDQTHDDWNHGPTAQGIERAFAVTAPELVDVAELGPKAADGTPGKNKVVYETDLTHIGHALLARGLNEIKELKATILELKATVALLLGGKPALA